MDRNIVYPGAIPLDTDLLNAQRNAMVALGFLAQATLGNGPTVSGLALTATSPATMSVVVAPGAFAVLGVVDTTAFGSLAADTSDGLVKLGINLTSTSLTLTAPATAGQSQNYLIQAGFSETDAVPVVLPYYNAANPSQPYAGPGNGGGSQNTQRIQRVTLQLKAGAPAATGSQTTPAADSGFAGLYAITVTNGQTQITTANLVGGNPYGAALVPTAPFVQFPLPTLAPGFSRSQVFTSSGTFTVPAGVTKVEVIVVGGGGGGSNASTTAVSPGASLSSGGGGSGGGLAWGTYSVTPGATVTVTVGAGGASQSAGGNSSFGAFCSATGGGGTLFQSSSTSAGGNPGTGSGGNILNATGNFGSDGQSGSFTGMGNGAPGPWGGGGRAYAGGASAQPANASAPGAGGGGCYAGTSGTNSGGTGASGIVIVKY